MSNFKAESFPHLKQFVGAYLHQDYVDEHGSHEGAARDFAKGANAARLSVLQKELDDFLGHAHSAKWDQVEKWWTDELGSAWVPADIKELAQLRKALVPARKTNTK